MKPLTNLSTAMLRSMSREGLHGVATSLHESLGLDAVGAAKYAPMDEPQLLMEVAVLLALRDGRVTMSRKPLAQGEQTSRSLSQESFRTKMVA